MATSLTSFSLKAAGTNVLPFFCLQYLVVGGGIELSSLYDSKKRVSYVLLIFIFNFHFQYVKDTFYPLFLLLRYFSVLLWGGGGGGVGGGTKMPC